MYRNPKYMEEIQGYTYDLIRWKNGPSFKTISCSKFIFIVYKQPHTTN